MPEPRSAAVIVALLAALLEVDEPTATTDRHHREGIGLLGQLAGSLRDRVLDVVGPD